MRKDIGRIEFLKLLSKHLSKKKLQLVEDAYNLSKYGHRNQLRIQGTRYFDHPKAVALIIIKELKIYDYEILVMALLHDILEDTFIISRNGLKSLFGKRVASGLDFLTKIDTDKKYVMRMGKCRDKGVFIVKFADRLHNLRTMEDVKSSFIKKKVIETKKLYLPFLDEIVDNEKKYLQQFTYLKIAINNAINTLQKIIS